MLWACEILSRDPCSGWLTSHMDLRAPLGPGPWEGITLCHARATQLWNWAYKDVCGPFLPPSCFMHVWGPEGPYADTGFYLEFLGLFLFLSKISFLSFFFWVPSYSLFSPKDCGSTSSLVLRIHQCHCCSYVCSPSWPPSASWHFIQWHRPYSSHSAY